MDLKRYIDSGNQHGTPITLDIVKVNIRSISTYRPSFFTCSLRCIFGSCDELVMSSSWPCVFRVCSHRIRLYTARLPHLIFPFLHSSIPAPIQPQFVYCVSFLMYPLCVSDRRRVFHSVRCFHAPYRPSAISFKRARDRYCPICGVVFPTAMLTTSVCQNRNSRIN